MVRASRISGGGRDVMYASCWGVSWCDSGRLGLMLVGRAEASISSPASASPMVTLSAGSILQLVSARNWAFMSSFARFRHMIFDLRSSRSPAFCCRASRHDRSSFSFVVDSRSLACV